MYTEKERMAEHAMNTTAVEARIERCRLELARLIELDALSAEERDSMADLLALVRGMLEDLTDRSPADSAPEPEALSELYGMLKLLMNDINFAYTRLTAC